MPRRVIFTRHFTLLVILMISIMGCDRETGDFQEFDWGLDQAPVNTTCLAPERSDTGFGIRIPKVFPGLSFFRPVLMLQGPHGDDLWYVLEQEGKISVFNKNNAVGNLKTFADIKKRVTYGGERGLLGMAFHPGFRDDRRVFISCTGDKNGKLTSIISSFEAAANGLSLKTATEKKILS